MSNGFVYFIQEEETDRIKIGFSEKHPQGRLKEFQTGNSNKLNLIGFSEGTYEDETRLHKEFSEERIGDGGEWFESSTKLKERVKALLEQSLEDKKRGINILSLQKSSTENEDEYEEVSGSEVRRIESVTYPNGDEYVGLMKNNQPHGKGRYTYAENKVYKEYVGEWKEGIFHGKGKMIFVDGYTEPSQEEKIFCFEDYFVGTNFEIYEGEWKEGKFHGKGYYKSNFKGQNGFYQEQIYEGEFKNGQEHGKGVKIILPDGDILKKETYEGEFKNGQEHGQGTYIYPGKYCVYRKEGEHQNGDLWNGSIYDNEKGDLLVKVVDGKEKKKPRFGWW